uniref:Uncharacterized protein MANES_16G101100 n=1 Tax=Rhizophora mucronata TaxID=61149 RepID=A0A2P2KPT8_RHIMU
MDFCCMNQLSIKCNPCVASSLILTTDTELQISEHTTFVDRKPWHRITISFDPVSWNNPTRFSRCLFGITTFCC